MLELVANHMMRSEPEKTIPSTTVLDRREETEETGETTPVTRANGSRFRGAPSTQSKHHESDELKLRVSLLLRKDLLY
jgi:hypothetical protein